jgi:hypothetical protein
LSYWHSARRRQSRSPALMSEDSQNRGRLHKFLSGSEMSEWVRQRRHRPHRRSVGLSHDSGRTAALRRAGGLGHEPTSACRCDHLVSASIQQGKMSRGDGKITAIVGIAASTAVRATSAAPRFACSKAVDLGRRRPVELDCRQRPGQRQSPRYQAVQQV